MFVVWFWLHCISTAANCRKNCRKQIASSILFSMPKVHWTYNRRKELLGHWRFFLLRGFSLVKTKIQIKFKNYFSYRCQQFVKYDRCFCVFIFVSLSLNSVQKYSKLIRICYINQFLSSSLCYYLVDYPVRHNLLLQVSYN